MAERIDVHYVLANSEDQARRLARAIYEGRIPPMAKNRAELVALRLLHPVAMIGSVVPFAVFTGLEREATSRLISGDWDREVRAMFEAQEQRNAVQ